jgi:hypothetical protein
MTLELQLAVDTDGRISELVFLPGLASIPETLDEAAAQFDDLAEVSALLVAEVDDDGTCLPIVDLRSDLVLPLGSVFKLYVLGAVSTAVDEGVVTWDQPVTIRDELDSLPSGDTQEQAAGTTLTVEQLAGAMIAISDNTATDHLIDLVGRDRVESALASFGHADPSATLPFLTTREAFVLKLDDSLSARYRNAGEDERRELLDGEVAERPLPALDSAVVSTWNEPRGVTSIEWFASPADICRALVALDDLHGDPAQAPVRQIMTANQEIYRTGQDFVRVLSKGGSEPGVHFEAILAVTPVGERFAVIGGAASETDLIDPALSRILIAALELVPQELA